MADTLRLGVTNPWKGVHLRKFTPAYPPEFRAEAMQLVHTGAKSLAAIAHDLGVSVASRRHWVRQAMILSTHCFTDTAPFSRRNRMPGASWITHTSSLVFSAAPWFTVLRQEVELPNGKVLSDYYRIESADYTKVVAVTPDRRLVFVRGYQHGVGKVSLQAPGGILEPGETPEEGARRELFEETGYAAPHWHPLGEFVMDSNRYYAKAHIFLALDATQAGPALGDGVEDLETALMPVTEFLSEVRHGRVELFATVAAVTLAMAIHGLSLPA